MTRALGSLLVALVIVACTETPTAAPAQAVPTLSSEAAALTINGSGEFCGPWWFGCGGVLVIKPAGWQFPTNWTSSDDETQLVAERTAGSEEPARVTGVAHQGQDRIEPGDYTVAGIMTEQSDVATEPPSASLGCSRELTISRGTVAVTIDIEFFASRSCRLTFSLDGPSGSASPSAG